MLCKSKLVTIDDNRATNENVKRIIRGEENSKDYFVLSLRVAYRLSTMKKSKIKEKKKENTLMTKKKSVRKQDLKQEKNKF